MKKFFTLFVTLIMLLASTNGVFAAQNDQSSQENGLFMLSGEVPENTSQFTSIIFPKMLQTKLTAESQDDSSLDTNIANYYLGNPFQLVTENIDLIDTFYYPVFYGDTIVSTLMIYPINTDNVAEDSLEKTYGLSGTLTDGIAEELNEIKENTNSSPNDAILINRKNDDLYYLFQGQNELLKDLPTTSEENTFINARSVNLEDLSNVQDQLNLKAVDVTEPNQYANSGLRRRDDNAPNYIYVNGISLEERQTTKAWCQAYVVAAIMRSQTPHRVYAYDIVRWINPNLSDEDLDKITGTYDGDVIGYARSLGMTPGLVNGQMPLDRVITLMRVGNRISTQWNMYDANGARVAGHSIALTGVTSYPNSASPSSPFIVYQTWNPWYSFTMDYMCNQFEDSITLNGYYSTWRSSIYNFVY